MTPFGTRLPPRSRSAGPLCAGIDPHAGAAARVGARRRRGGAGAVRARPRWRRLAPHVVGREAAVGVLRAVRQPRDRGARAGRRRVPRRRRAGAAGRQARRHRLDQPGLRRRLPRPRLAARLRRDHRQPLPRLRLARPDGRGPPAARRRPVRARADLQQGGARGPARPHRRTARSPARCSPTCAPSTRGPSRSAPSARSSAPRSARPSEDLDFNGPLLAPGFGAQGGTVDDLRAHLRARRRGGRSPAPRATCCGAGPDVGALRDAARRGNDAVRGLAA